MADQSDVEGCLVALVASALYPSGTGAACVSGNDCRIYRGWPTSSALNADLSAGLVNVTIFPAGEPGHTTTRYLPKWTTSQSLPTLSVLTTSDRVTFSGTAAVGQTVGILADNKSYVYKPQSTDTPQTVAGNLAAAIRVDRIANLSDSTVTIPGASRLVARVAVAGQASYEARRQRQRFRITCWCPDPASRDACAVAIDSFFAPLSYIDLADSTSGRLWYCGTLVFDQSQDAQLYRRDLLYEVEYATICTVLQSAMLFGGLNLNCGQYVS